MTPGARVAAAIGVIDRIGAGAPAEQALTNWARGARYAGSGDRAAVRDHVFDVLRTWRSSATRGGGSDGRARLLGNFRLQGLDPASVFSGQGHAPAPLTPAEISAGRRPEGVEALDLPDWLWPLFEEGLGLRAAEVAEALRHRAPVFLRVNTLRADLAAAIAALAEDGIAARPHALSPTALAVEGRPGRLRASRAFRDGLVELQDAASQAVVDLLPLRPGLRVLDYCAGGGGKALAMAARMGGGPVRAHDADPARMADLPARAARAGARVEIGAAADGPFDLVLCDAPCSGSGAWRRSPDGKWRLAPERLAALTGLQRGILNAAAALVAPGGTLSYATCSVLRCENEAVVAAFLAGREGWRRGPSRQFLPADGGDGFFLARLTRE